MEDKHGWQRVLVIMDAPRKMKHNVEVEFIRNLVHDEKGNVLSGELVAEEKIHNINTDAGLDYAAEAMAVVMTPFSHIGVGSGSTGAAAGDTTLETEIERVGILSYDFPSTGVVRFRAIFESNQGNGSVREFGLFNAAAAGTMGARSVLGASYTKDTSLSIRVTWTITTTDA